MMDLKAILEAILFSAPRPLSPDDLRGVLNAAAEESEDESVLGFKKVDLEAIESALADLARLHEEAGRPFRLACVAGAWQFVTQPEYAPWVRIAAGERPRSPRLSQAALETLAIVAYRQPITKAEIEQIRGVSVDGVMQTLQERGLVEAVGRAEVVGRPMSYGTTRLFLEYFGLAGIDQLPDADELRRIPVAKPPALMTAEPGLVTMPPEELRTESAIQEATEPQLAHPGQQDYPGQAPVEHPSDDQPPGRIDEPGAPEPSSPQQPN